MWQCKEMGRVKYCPAEKHAAQKPSVEERRCLGQGSTSLEGLRQPGEPPAAVLLQLEEQPKCRNLLSSSSPDRAGSFPPADAVRAFRFVAHP